jgi:glycosyltransferase involved in cell wall biosynthesis
VYQRAGAFIAASQGGLALYRSYQVPAARCFRSCLAVDNTRFQPREPGAGKTWDFIVSGRLEAGKHPEFAMDVALQCSQRLGRRLTLLFAGSGSEEAALRARAKTLDHQLSVHFHGFATQSELPELYRGALGLVYPSLWEGFGLPVLEAFACGTPVTACV